MKKIFTLLTAVMLVLGLAANAQERKTWNFAKGVSDESRALLDADVTNWSKNVDAETGVSTAWTSNVKVTGELMAGGSVLKETQYLQFGDFEATNSVMLKTSSIRFSKACSITLPALKAGQQIAIVASSANATATDRGFALENAADAEGNSSFITLGRDAEGAPAGGVYNIVATVIADGTVKLSTGLTGAPKAGIEIVSIIIDEGDKNIKRWDFSNWSAATKAQVVGSTDWTTAESATKNYITGEEIRWALTPTFDANSDLTAGGSAIAEMKGLRHNNLAAYGYAMAFDYGTTLDGNNWGPYAGGSYLWVTQANSSIVVPNVKAESTLKLGVETHKPADARGFKVIVGGVEVATQTATDLATLEYTIPANDNGYVDVEIKATKGCHLYFIEAEVKDETVVDLNPRLGSVKFSIKEGAKIRPTTEGFTMTFPNQANINPDAVMSISGYLGPKTTETPDDYLFEGITTMAFDGFNILFTDIFGTLEENTEYVFNVTSLTIDGYPALSETAAEGEVLYELNFETSGPGITTKREWAFTSTEEDATTLAAAAEKGYWNVSSKGRYSVSTKMFADGNEVLLVDEATPFRLTDGLLFSMTNDNDILIGTPAGNNGKLQLGGGAPVITIPSVSAGDEVTVKALWSTKNRGKITLINGTAEDGTNEITLTGSAAEYKITVVEDGDLSLKSANTIYNSISIWPISMPKETVEYTVNAVDPDGNILKTLATGKAQTNEIVEAPYSYWLMNEKGDVFTKGSKGVPFVESITIENESVLNVAYKATDMTGAVLCVEGEDIPGVTLCDHANMAIRSSNAKAAYNTSDITVATLQPGTYKIAAILFDANSSPSYLAMFMVGTEPVMLQATGVNFSEVVSDYFTVTEPTDVVWMSASEGAANKGLDAMVIYSYDPNAVAGVEESVSESAAAKTVVKDGKLVIVSSKGEYTPAGAKIK